MIYDCIIGEERRERVKFDFTGTRDQGEGEWEGRCHEEKSREVKCSFRL